VVADRGAAASSDRAEGETVLRRADEEQDAVALAVVLALALALALALGSVLQPPEPGERGWKHTVIAYPGQVTWVQLTSNTAGE